MIDQAFSFLLETLAGFFTALFLARFFMQWQRVSFINPAGQFILHVTHAILAPFRHFMPSFRRFDIASLVAAYLFQFIQTMMLFALSGSLGRLKVDAFFLPLALPLFLEPLRGCLRIVLHLLTGVLLLHALFSWTQPYAPAATFLAQLTRPFLNPIRRFVPLIAHIDLSPLIALVLIRFLLILL